MQNILRGSVCALALATLPLAAHAQMTGFSGTLSGDYANTHVSGAGNANDWGGEGSAKFDFGSSFAGQLDGGYHNLNGSGTNIDNWSIDGTLLWQAPMGRAGAAVGYNDFTGGGANVNVTNYGGYGEWFAGRAITLGIKGGGFSGSGSTNGYYAGGQLTGYLGGDFSLSGSVDYAHLSHFGNETDYTARGEWLISERLPISVYGGYAYSSFTGSTHADTFFVGLKFYCNGNGATDLVDRQRTGNVGWATQFSPLVFQY